MLTSLIHIKNWHFPINKHIQSFCLISKSKKELNCQSQPAHNNQRHDTINTDTHSNKQSRHPLYVHRYKHYLFSNSSSHRLLYYYADTYKPEVDGISWLKKQSRKSRLLRYENDEVSNQQPYYIEYSYNDKNRIHGQKNYAIPNIPASPIYKYISITMPAQLQQLLILIQDEPFNCTLSPSPSTLDSNSNINSNKYKYKEKLENKIIQISKTIVEMIKNIKKQDEQFNVFEFLCTLSAFIKKEGIFVNFLHRYPVWRRVSGLVWDEFVEQRKMLVGIGEKLVADFNQYQLDLDAYNQMVERKRLEAQEIANQKQKEATEKLNAETQQNTENQQFTKKQQITPKQQITQKQETSTPNTTQSSPPNTTQSSPSNTTQSSPPNTAQSSPPNTTQSSPPNTTYSSPPNITQSSPPNTAQSSPPNPTPNTSLPPPPQPPIPPISTLSTLLTNIQLLPQSMYPSILQSLLHQLPKQSNQTLTIFMSECILGDIKLSKQFCQQFHYLADLRQWKCTYRFYYLSFIQHYMSTTYLPLYRVSNFVRFSDILDELFHDYYNVRAFLIWLAKEYEVDRKTSGRAFISIYNRRIKQIQSIINNQRFNSEQIMSLYNIMSSQYAMGLIFLSNMDNWRKPKQDKILTSMHVIKKFILNIQNSIIPQYIYSIEQGTALQLNTNVLQRIKKQLKNILKYEQQFILEIPTIIQYISDSFFNQNFNVIATLCQTIDNIVTNLDVNRSDYQRVVRKIVGFMFGNQDYLGFQAKKKFVSQQIQVIKNKPPTTPQHWLHIFQLSKLYKPQDTTKTIQNIIQTYHIPFIQKQMQQHQNNKNSSLSTSCSSSFSSPTINSYRPEYENILCMFNLLQKQYYMERPQLCILLINFINEKFVYSAKSVLKYKVFWILELFGKVGGERDVRVDAEIYGYLWTNLSCFIIYIKKKNKFFLRRGRNFCNDSYFLQTLRSLGQQNTYLRNLQNKDRLKMLRTLLQVYWNKLAPRQIAKLLIIIGNPTQLSNSLRVMLKNSVFTYSAIDGLDYLVLEKFKLRNKTLALALNKVEDKNREESVLVLSNQMDKFDSKNVFKNQEFYEQAMYDPNFTEQSLIPQPQTQDKKIKMIYTCLRITNKIRNNSTFSIQDQLSRLLSQKQQNKILPHLSKQKINISQQHKYTIQNDLININQVNEFKLDNIEIKGHYQFVQGWNIHQMHTMFAYQLVDYNMFADAQANRYEKILLAIAGNYGIIKNLVKGEPFSSTVVQIISQFNVHIKVLGSLIQISESQESQNSLFIFYSSPKTSKFHLIYAYILSQIQKNVCIINEQTSQQQIKQLMKAFFTNKVDQSQNVSQGENQQIIQESQGSYGESYGESEGEGQGVKKGG